MERGLVAVYIIRGTLYVGVTSDLYRRVSEHQAGLIPGFTKEHDLNRLVWFEPHEVITTAIESEKSIKRYLREWKFNLIERDTPTGTTCPSSGMHRLSGGMDRSRRANIATAQPWALGTSPRVTGV